MTKFKKLAILFSICIPFLAIDCAEKQQNEFSKELFEYSKNIDEKNAEKGMQDHLPTVVSDITSNHYFDTGKTRIKITKEIKNGMVITTTEKWVMKNSSYLTNMNIAAISALIIAAGLPNLIGKFDSFVISKEDFNKMTEFQKDIWVHAKHKSSKLFNYYNENKPREAVWDLGEKIKNRKVEIVHHRNGSISIQTEATPGKHAISYHDDEYPNQGSMRYQEYDLFNEPRGYIEGILMSLGVIK